MCIQVDTAAIHAAKRINDTVHIFTRATLDRAPLRPVNEIQQLVIFHELQERAHRIIQHCLCRA